ncbi:MAG: PAQR family membrane homeostasis protein TrhA [Bacteroidales bacterium]
MSQIDKKLEIKKELVNAISHAFGIIFGITAMPILIAMATKNNNTLGIIGCAIYAFTFLMVFSFSTAYHAFFNEQAKKVLRVFDHISIFFLIAGTYTPILLMYFFNTWGISILSALWGLTLMGIFLKTFFTGRFKLVSTIIYLLMGWTFVVGAKQFFSVLPNSVLSMIIAGGVFYSLGVIFYLRKNHYSHGIFHLFILFGAICHYVGVLLMLIQTT